MIQRPFTFAVVAGFALLGSIGTWSRAKAAAPPAAGITLLPPAGVGAFTAPQTPDIAMETVVATGEPFTQALRLTTRRQPVNVWDYQITAVTSAPVTKGDTLFATFWMRCASSAAGYGLTEFVFEDATTYNKSVAYAAMAGSQWKRCQVPFTAAQDEAAGQAHVNFHLGYPPQTIEIGGVTLVDYGRSVAVGDLPRTVLSYEGRARNAPWRKAAAARIEKYRKGDLIVQVIDSHGKPVSGAAVAVSMTRQAFGFGSAVDLPFMADTPDGRKYREMTYRLFNRAVVGNSLKWRNWEHDDSGYGRAIALKFVAELRDRHLDVRGHNLIWPSKTYLPADVWSLRGDPPALKKRIDDHIADEVGALKGQCVEWDVVNEAYFNHDVMDILGNDIVARWYREAHAADPQSRLFINDYDITESGGVNKVHIDAYDKTISDLLAAGAPLGGIGLQSHFGDVLTAPDKVYSILNRFARFGLPLEITEFDVNTTDEQLKADYWRDYLTIAYSHPAVSAFMMWGFWEGDHWIPAAALWSKDWKERPAAKVLTDLLLRQWRTNVSGRSDAHGSYRTRAFLGDYKITATLGARTKTVECSFSRSLSGRPAPVVVKF